ncbi:MAG: hypothetical protein A2275_08760 [Bacteroidetes bacterium RIFOXYA12_FULL_35_11]|nr:MAG: hypothetical protein A2X01_05885 [Bacteroidetes bacterium GWF2_35_48]OFY82892.1 MAG: hypothetical protein A2275_08760 [Bacteroidetes bacterium RIFOXYA12_FULL_35_11]OFY92936.1 MAG: hypothetical protein A2309_12640 [Bacteroidetes bacterium RIFOXYB2_FULL_35_7]OFY95803.1 MAG: hypothetical protein A2491_10360 [Bacteroidetes bacterium RIFOXYC12_FULL_35_7]HBX52797.1 hypothetical protein [Bacteroidales bacterium]
MHGPAAKLETDHAAAKKSKLGVILFIFYLLVYTGFVLIGLLDPDMLSVHVLGKQNLAIVYGFGLIVLAVIMGFIYNAACTKMENKMNKK